VKPPVSVSWPSSEPITLPFTKSWIRFLPVDLAAATTGNISTVQIFIPSGYVQETDLLIILYKNSYIFAQFHYLILLHPFFKSELNVLYLKPFLSTF
jgi:hypothetical protein